MSWSKTTTIWCDSDECENWVSYNGTLGDAENHFVDNGEWRKKSAGEHYCPNCSEDNDQNSGESGE